ncbi:MAG TPA: LegC family aminotransferase, partial [Bacilli bacterium]|nr:LegC family aminotransferase [Bacilli bacterium]
GTAALHIALLLAGVEHNDEVLVPALTFVATANAVSYCGAIPHFIDIEERTLGVDPLKLRTYLKENTEIKEDGCYNKETRRRIKAIVPMHTFGHPVDLDALADVCEEFKIELVEDAAESLGSYYKGKHTGNFGKISAFSFNGNKIITTGGGGAIVTNDEELADKAKHLTTTAKVPHRWEYIHDEVGYNYRMPNINAALGVAQLEQLPTFIEKKRQLAIKYAKAFQGISNVSFFKEPEFAKSNYWLQTILLSDETTDFRDKVLEALNATGLMSRPAWTLMHKLPMYKQCPKMDLSVAERMERQVVNIPSGVMVSE